MPAAIARPTLVARQGKAPAHSTQVCRYLRRHRVADPQAGYYRSALKRRSARKNPSGVVLRFCRPVRFFRAGSGGEGEQLPLVFADEHARLKKPLRHTRRSGSVQQSRGINLSGKENRDYRRRKMLRLIAVAVAGLALATSAQALTPAPLHHPDEIISQVRFGCGPGRTLVAGRCVARTTIRHTRRVIRRSY